MKIYIITLTLLIPSTPHEFKLPKLLYLSNNMNIINKYINIQISSKCSINHHEFMHNTCFRIQISSIKIYTLNFILLLLRKRTHIYVYVNQKVLVCRQFKVQRVFRILYGYPRRVHESSYHQSRYIESHIVNPFSPLAFDFAAMTIILSVAIMRNARACVLYKRSHGDKHSRVSLVSMTECSALRAHRR